jgi:hypothetical protein
MTNYKKENTTANNYLNEKKEKLNISVKSIKFL